MPSGREAYERQAEERRRIRRAQREAARRSRRRRQALASGAFVVVLAFVAVIVLVIATGSGKKGVSAAGTSTSPSASTSAGSSAAPTSCDFTADSSTKTATSPGLPPSTPATGKHTLTITFGQGPVVVALDPKAPCTITSFQFLASKNFFTGTHCHRLTTSGIYVLQCGDPTGTGTGGPGYTIPDENLTGATYPAGTVAMANTGTAHTGGSQFFVVYKDSSLPPQYTPFGTITSGLDIITKIAAAGVQGGGTDGTPATTATIKSFTIS